MIDVNDDEEEEKEERSREEGRGKEEEEEEGGPSVKKRQRGPYLNELEQSSTVCFCVHESRQFVTLTILSCLFVQVHHDRNERIIPTGSREDYVCEAGLAAPAPVDE